MAGDDEQVAAVTKGVEGLQIGNGKATASTTKNDGGANKEGKKKGKGKGKGDKKQKKKREKYEGTIKLLYADKQFVFIENEAIRELYEKDIFGHKNKFKNKDEFAVAKRGDKVNFYVKVEDGNPQAVGIRLVEGDTAIKERAKRKIFPEYISKKKVVDGMLKKDLVEGVLRVNARKPWQAYIDLGDKKKEGDKDILITDPVARNRAVHGDRVIVRFDDKVEEVQDMPLDEEEEKENEKDDDSDSSSSDEEDEEEKEKRLAKAVAEMGFDDGWKDAAQTEKKEDQRVASVVFIGDYSGRNRTFVCTLIPNSKEGQRGETCNVKETEKMVKAVPIDKRFPHILIYLTEDLKKKLKVPGKLNKFQYWQAKITKWDETSILPLGELAAESIGEAGDIKAEVSRALCEADLEEHARDFPDEILDQVDNIVEDFERTLDDVAKTRIDLRNRPEIRVTTIDPATARDLDDAIHIVKIAPQIWEFGVHIADVAHFVKPGTAVDKEAKFRCTSCYMPNQVLPMLPHALCNYLCSLNPNENKCSFSVFYRIDGNGMLMLDKENEPRMAKTVINTCCRLNYDQVQDMFDGKELVEGEDRPECYHGVKWHEVKKDIFMTYEVCQKIRKARFQNGAMQMSKHKMIFTTKDSSNGMPTGYMTEHHSASHWVIEELMLLANQCVGRIMQKDELMGDYAVLRNHPTPDSSKAKDLLQLMADCKIHYENTTAKDLHQTFEKIRKNFGDQLADTIQTLTMKSGMRPASYYPEGSGEESHHFALNFPVYTHFTSPIRRYADVLVHRVCNAILEKRSREDFLQVDMDDEDRKAVPDPDAMKNKLPELNTADLSDDEEKMMRGKKGRKNFDTEKAVDKVKKKEEEDEEDEEGEKRDAKNDQAVIALANQCKRCNEKKKQSKDCQEDLDRAWFCMYLRGKTEWWYSVATVTKVEPNFVEVYAHQIGKEKKVQFDTRTDHKIPNLFVKDVQDEIMLPDSWEYKSKSWVTITWSNRKVENTMFLYGDDRPDLEETEGKVIGAEETGKPVPPGLEELAEDFREIDHEVHMLSVVSIVLIPTNTVPIDFVMMLVSPFHPQHRHLKITEKEKRGFNFAPLENTGEDGEDDDGMFNEHKGAGWKNDKGGDSDESDAPKFDKVKKDKREKKNKKKDDVEEWQPPAAASGSAPEEKKKKKKKDADDDASGDDDKDEKKKKKKEKKEAEEWKLEGALFEGVEIEEVKK